MYHPSSDPTNPPLAYRRHLPPAEAGGTLDGKSLESVGGQTSVAIVGGGITGLSAALHLAESISKPLSWRLGTSPSAPLAGPSGRWFPI